jgi:hypothetical protein
MVGYAHDLPGKVWTIPDLIMTTKLKKFAISRNIDSLTPRPMASCSRTSGFN